MPELGFSPGPARSHTIFKDDRFLLKAILGESLSDCSALSAIPRVGIPGNLRSSCCIHPPLARLPGIYAPVPPAYAGDPNREKQLHTKTDFEYNKTAQLSRG